MFGFFVVVVVVVVFWGGYATSVLSGVTKAFSGFCIHQFRDCEMRIAATVQRPAGLVFTSVIRIEN